MADRKDSITEQVTGAKAQARTRVTAAKGIPRATVRKDIHRVEQIADRADNSPAVSVRTTIQAGRSHPAAVHRSLAGVQVKKADRAIIDPTTTAATATPARTKARIAAARAEAEDALRTETTSRVRSTATTAVAKTTAAVNSKISLRAKKLTIRRRKSLYAVR